MGWLDWSDVDNATGYELHQNIPQNGSDRWIDITVSSDQTTTRGFVHGWSAISVDQISGRVDLRVRATFQDGTASGWYNVAE